MSRRKKNGVDKNIIPELGTGSNTLSASNEQLKSACDQSAKNRKSIKERGIKEPLQHQVLSGDKIPKIGILLEDGTKLSVDKVVLIDKIGGDASNTTTLNTAKRQNKKKKSKNVSCPTDPAVPTIFNVQLNNSVDNSNTVLDSAVKLGKNAKKKRNKHNSLQGDEHNLLNTNPENLVESRNCLKSLNANSVASSTWRKIYACTDILELQNILSSPLPNKSDSCEMDNDVNIDVSRLTLLESKGRNETRTARKKKKKKDYVFENLMDESEALEQLKDNKLIEGVLRINPKHYQTAYVSSPVSNEPDYVIHGVQNRNRALEGDVVLLLPDHMPYESDSEETAQKTGKVVFIKQWLHPRTCVGYLELMKDGNRKLAVFVPRDHRIPRMYIPFTCWPTLFYEQNEKYSNVLFVAKIDKWIDIQFAYGTLLSNLGYCGDLKVECMAILAENGLDVTPFSSDVEQFYPQPDYVIPENEILRRKDCRQMCVFTIDPLTARDLDDAVSLKILDNGNYEVGVHIADVSFFLEEGTKLDEKVALKANTIYMIEKAYHMLPEDLCSLCSLLPGYDRLAFSVFWELTKNGEIKNQYFSRTIINSCTQLAYEHAQKIIENPEYIFSPEELPKMYGGWTPKDICQAVHLLYELSLILKKQRFDSGALRIDQPKLIFQLDPMSGFPISYTIYENKESHRLIEEFMLLANMTVAKKIYEDFPRLAFLRRHPAPNGCMLSELNKSLEPIGISLDVSTAGSLQKSLLNILNTNLKDEGMSLVLNSLIVKPMARALYFCADGCDDEDLCHYALNVPLYTHFTSPIRRFSDIVVHRLLSASLGYSDKPNWNINNLHKIALNCNRQKHNAKRAGEMSAEMYAYLYISQNAPLIKKAVVVNVRTNCIDTIIIDNGLNRRINLLASGAEVAFVGSRTSDRLNKVILTWPATDDSPVIAHAIGMFSIVNLILDKTKDPFKITSQLERPNTSTENTFY